MTDRLHALEMRLFAAAAGFYLVVLTVQVEPFHYYTGMCVFFALAMIPLKAISALVECYIIWRHDRQGSA